MPLFPGSVRNPDLLVEVSQSWFRSVWTDWFKALGLSGITTHQTRATLATALLNNGAPRPHLCVSCSDTSPKNHWHTTPDTRMPT